MINKKKLWRIVLIILLLPLLFINVKDSHDWGDDFAQYLIQARNIIEDKPQTDNGLIFFEGRPPYAIKAYPAGLPLLLAPLYGIYGLNLSPYMLLIAVMLIITGIICFEYFSRHENAIIAFLIAMLFCYNPTVLDLKKQILSELPFTCLLMLSLYWTQSKFYWRKNSWLLTGLIFGFLLSIRLIGLIAIAAYAFAEISKIIRKKEERSLSKLLLSVGISALIFFGINSWLLPIGTGELFGFYSEALETHSFRSAINFDYYYDVLKNFFPFWSLSISGIWLMTAFTGWFIRFVKFRTTAEYFFPLYLILIVFYPYSSGGYRLLIPVLPLLIFYFYYFLNWLFYWFGKKQHKITPAVLGICLLAYIPNTYSVIKNQSVIEDGPQRPEAIEMFRFLKTVPDDMPVFFPRARAMSLYSGHPALYPLVTVNYDTTLNDIRNMPVLIILTTNEKSQVFDKRLIEFVNKYPGAFKEVWRNGEYTGLYINHGG